MKHLISIGTLFAIVSSASACDVDEPREAADGMTKEEAALLVGKADLSFDVCDWLGWYGDGICDAWCPAPDPDCGGESCSVAGGMCLSSPIDVTFAADCEADFGMVTSPASCGEIINLSCCVPADDADPTDGDGGDPGDGGDGPTACEAAGGECHSSPIDVTFAANCEAELGMTTLDADCGDVINLSCCVPTDDDDVPATCESLGGQCLGSPIDVTFGAHCEADYGLEPLPGTCEFFNRTCCG
jgi:hypothetical protein